MHVDFYFSKFEKGCCSHGRASCCSRKPVNLAETGWSRRPDRESIKMQIACQVTELLAVKYGRTFSHFFPTSASGLVSFLLESVIRLFAHSGHVAFAKRPRNCIYVVVGAGAAKGFYRPLLKISAKTFVVLGWKIDRISTFFNKRRRLDLRGSQRCLRTCLKPKQANSNVLLLLFLAAFLGARFLMQLSFFFSRADARRFA